MTATITRAPIPDRILTTNTPVVAGRNINDSLARKRGEISVYFREASHGTIAFGADRDANYGSSFLIQHSRMRESAQAALVCQSLPGKTGG
jgi:hypothetical protein